MDVVAAAMAVDGVAVTAAAETDVAAADSGIDDTSFRIKVA